MKKLTIEGSEESGFEIWFHEKKSSSRMIHEDLSKEEAEEYLELYKNGYTCTHCNIPFIVLKEYCDYPSNDEFCSKDCYLDEINYRAEMAYI